MRRVREDIASERRYRADCHLPSKRVSRPIHQCKEGNRNSRANSPTNRSAEYVLETQCSQNIRARHHEKAGKPSPGEFFGCRTDKPTRTQIGECKASGLALYFFAVILPQNKSQTEFGVAHRECALHRIDRYANCRPKLTDKRVFALTFGSKATASPSRRCEGA